MVAECHRLQTQDISLETVLGAVRLNLYILESELLLTPSEYNGNETGADKRAKRAKHRLEMFGEQKTKKESVGEK